MLVEHAILCLQGQPVEQPHQMTNKGSLPLTGFVETVRGSLITGIVVLLVHYLSYN